MGKQSRSKRSDTSYAKGKVTPMQVAFIVDRYLLDNNFSETRSVFRNEGASLISKSPVQEVRYRFESVLDLRLIFAILVSKCLIDFCFGFLGSEEFVEFGSDVE